MPQWLDGVPAAIGVVGHTGIRHHRVRTSGTREAGRFGKTAKFDGHLPGAGNLKNGVGQTVVPNKRLVGGIEEDQRPVAPGEIPPTLQAFPLQ